MKAIKLLTTVCIMSQLSGCGTPIVNYKYDGPENIEISNDVDAGKNIFVSLTDYFHVYKVKPDCSGTEHLGGYKLTGKKSVQLSLPVNKLLLVEMAFSKHIIGSEVVAERRATFIKPKKGESYKFDFYYRETLTDLKLYKKKKKKKKETKMPVIPWSEEACKKLI